MTSFVEDLIRQNRMFDELYSNPAVKEALRLKDLIERHGGKEILRAYESGGSFENVAARCRRELDAIRGVSSVQQFEKQLEVASSLVKLVDQRGAAYKSASAVLESMVRSNAFNAVEQWQKMMAENPVHMLLRQIEETAQRNSNLFAQLNVGSSLAREIEATRKMLSSPEWAFLTSQTVRAFEKNLTSLYDPGSIYEELRRRVEKDLQQHGAAAPETDYVEIIEGHFREHNKKHTLGDVLAILVIVLHITAILHAEHSQNEIKAHTTRAATEVQQNIEKRLAKIESWREEAATTKWAARNSVVLVRTAGDSSAKRLAVLMPYQVVTQLDHDGKWIQVEFYDHKAGVPRVGWVQKKHLERLSGSGTAR